MKVPYKPWLKGDVSVARYGVLAGEGKTGNVGKSLKLL